MKSKQAEKKGPIYIVKVGTSALLNHPVANRLSQEAFNDLARQIYCASVNEIQPLITIVSSGAVQAGREMTEYRGNPFIATKPQLAGIGSYYLLDHWRQAFDKECFGRKFAQLWVTHANWQNEKERENIRANTLAYLQNGVIPIFNENDVVAPDEIASWEKGISENDQLAVMIAELIGAVGVVFVTSAGGVYSCDPTHDKDAFLYKTISPLDAKDIIKQSAKCSKGGTGGIPAKLNAALRCYEKGIRVGIFGINKKAYGDLSDFIAGKEIGTTIAGKTTF